MSDRIKKIKFDKLTSEKDFLEKELKYQKEMIQSIIPEFDKEYRRHVEKAGLTDVFFPKNLPPKKAPNPKPNRETRRKMKKKKASKGVESLFKKVAKEIHPDKLTNFSKQEQESKKKKFLEASEAKNNNDSLKMYSIASELGLLIDNISEEQFSIFEQQIDNLKSELEKLNNSWIAAWMNAPEGSKNAVMSNYLGYVLSTKQTMDKK